MEDIVKTEEDLYSLVTSTYNLLSSLYEEIFWNDYNLWERLDHLDLMVDNSYVEIGKVYSLEYYGAPYQTELIKKEIADNTTLILDTLDAKLNEYNNPRYNSVNPQLTAIINAVNSVKYQLQINDNDATKNALALGQGIVTYSNKIMLNADKNTNSLIDALSELGGNGVGNSESIIEAMTEAFKSFTDKLSDTISNGLSNLKTTIYGPTITNVLNFDGLISGLTNIATYIQENWQTYIDNKMIVDETELQKAIDLIASKNPSLT